jgi:hypothetical protein
MLRFFFFSAIKNIKKGRRNIIKIKHNKPIIFLNLRPKPLTILYGESQISILYKKYLIPPFLEQNTSKDFLSPFSHFL